MPKSTRQISPGRVLFIPGFHGIEHLESLQSKAITLGQRLRVGFGFEDNAHNLPPLFVRKLRNLRNDLRFAHGLKFRLLAKLGKCVVVID